MQIYRLIVMKKETLLSKCFHTTEPKVVSIKPVPLYETSDIDRPDKNLRRAFNHAVEKHTNRYKHFYVQNMAQIMPDDRNLYDIRMYSLSRSGFEVLWAGIDKTVGDLDDGQLHNGDHKMPPSKYKNIAREKQFFKKNKIARKRSGTILVIRHFAFPSWDISSVSCNALLSM